ncbi:MAG TPA: glucosidase, partial [Candidatus Dormibacteraeota bacterium]|nr:glucosidase [Candidatus Dormibacteraeota bacterium]
MPRLQTREDERLEETRTRKKYWKRWGPYLSERQWGTVREDYSPYGTAWEYFPHDHARSRAYRWGEDGIGGISDRHQMICFGLAMWNGRDPILKERLFGLTGHQGNHGEDVKEYYFYLDSTPTHSYMQMLYKYPQAEFPYDALIAENSRRDRTKPEFELMDTGVFAENRYFDVFVEYAKADVEDILIKIIVVNRGPETATLHLLPSLWFRNTWSWGKDDRRPTIRKTASLDNCQCAEMQHWQYGKRWLLCAGQPQLLFTENQTDYERIFNIKNPTPFVKDAFHEYLIHKNQAAINPQQIGTKMAAYYPLTLGPGDSTTLKLRLTDMDPLGGISPDSHKVDITSPGHDDPNEEIPASNDFGT